MVGPLRHGGGANNIALLFGLRRASFPCHTFAVVVAVDFASEQSLHASHWWLCALAGGVVDAAATATATTTTTAGSLTGSLRASPRLVTYLFMVNLSRGSRGSMR